MHSIWHSRGQLAVTNYTPEERASLPPVPQRVVRTHPGSGRKTLYLAAHASHIIGMPVADGRLLADGPDRARDAAAVRPCPHLAARATW